MTHSDTQATHSSCYGKYMPPMGDLPQLFGDAAFVDLMILRLSLQLHMLASRALRISLGVVVKGGRWLGVPSPGLACLLTFSAIAIGCKLAALQKALHRVSTLM